MNATLTNNIKHLLMALVTQGVRDFVVSPGSRTTPIALLLAELAHNDANIRITIDVDERSAGFFALGLAKTKSWPVVLLATSGTATANYFPAIAEAKIAHVPLIVLTTDRPQELQNIGAAQTIDQVKMYGTHAKEFAQITLQDDNANVTEYIDYHVQQLVNIAATAPAGVVQINLPLRKPLMPDLGEAWPNIKRHNILASARTPQKNNIEEFVMLMKQSKVLIMAGPAEGRMDTKAVLVRDLAELLKVPVLADVLSSVRPDKWAINGIDALLEADVIAADLIPDVVFRFGGTPVSARVSGWLKQNNVTLVQVGEDSVGHDYTRYAKLTLNCDEETLLEAMQSFGEQADENPFGTAWLQVKDTLNQTVAKAEFSEATLPVALQALPYGAEIFIANSMPIRDMDNYFVPRNPVRAFANRGANGIDGTVSSAFGMAMSGNPAYLLTGDLTLFHDMNGLMLAQQTGRPMTIIVVNNNGGGIFSFLPQAAAKDYFEPMFGTPLNLSIEKIAALYDAEYLEITSKEQLAQTISVPADKLKIIEIKSDRDKNVGDHRQLIDQIKAAFND